MQSKRGISPLIATVILITLAAALGVVVLNFGRVKIEVASQCAVDIGLRVVKLNEKDQVCFDREKNQLFFIVENGNQLPVEGVRMRIIGGSAVYSEDVAGSRIEKAEALLKYIPYDASTYGAIKQVKITPRISLYEEEIACPEQAVVLEDIRDCEK